METASQAGPNTSTPLISGEVPGTQDDATTAAEAAIDKFLENGRAADA
jgi:hypothetical protein